LAGVVEEEGYTHSSGVVLPIKYGDYILLKVAKCFPELAQQSQVVQDQLSKQDQGQNEEQSTKNND